MYLFPSCDLLVAPDAWNAINASSLLGDEGALCDEECSWYTGALLVVLLHQGYVRYTSGRVCSNSRAGSKDDTVFEMCGADSDGLEELGCGGDRTHVRLELTRKGRDIG